MCEQLGTIPSHPLYKNFEAYSTEDCKIGSTGIGEKARKLF